jgi:hypothetical protein
MKYLWMVGFLTMIGCAQGNCRSQKLDSVESSTTPLALPSQRIRVYKYDGSKQCGMGKAMSLDEMKKQLGDIPVFSQMNMADNLMRTQVCGNDTGRANVFEIDQSRLEDAKKKGFKEWTFD